MAAIPPWRLFWAKTDRSGERPEWTRPLWAHLLDVANVASLLWESVVPRTTKRQLSTALDTNEQEAGQWLSLLIGLHDLGKAIPCFQWLHPPSRSILSDAGLPLRTGGYDRDQMIHHGHATIPIIKEWLEEEGSARGWSVDTVEGLAAIVGFHHGRLLTREMWGVNGKLGLPDNRGTEPWKRTQRDLLRAVVDVWNAPVPRTLPGVRRCWPGWLLPYAGWCTLADWLGSMEKMYPEVEHGGDLAAYMAQSRRGAEEALESAGFRSRASLRMVDFGAVFTGRDGIARNPRPLQSVMIDTLPVNDGEKPTLTIVEAPTGEGKTEAALYLALRQQVGGGPGIYVAMPSQATSNGLFGRVESFLSRTHDSSSGAVNLLLLHGMSALHPDQERLVDVFLNARRTMSPLYDREGAAQSTHTEEARVETATWFLPKKRSLLAPYGVGTVDQALLGVLYARHFFLRHIGLAGKTVIFDEVHAYDTYMNALFHRLLKWLRQNGTNVVVLSATLPDRTRRAMTQAWTGEEPAPSPDYQPYPAVWHLGSTGQIDQPVHFPAALHQKAHLRLSSPEPSVIAETVVDAVRAGAAVAVIINTVARAQEIYRVILEALEQSVLTPDTLLFHARFPYELRSDIEARVRARFGPGREPGVPAVLVATQVAEQSLDFDVDLMLSDLAPIDLLLQRAGRLHRHEDHHAGRRPAPYAQPVLHILVENPEKGRLPDIEVVSGRGHVYQRAVLYRTWWLLETMPAGWSLPDDYRALIEGVYSDKAGSAPDHLDEEAGTRWQKAEKDWNEQCRADENEALNRMIPLPDDLRRMVEQRKPEQIEQDNAPVETHPAYLALTRLAGLSFDVVCLHQDARGRLWLDSRHTEPLPASLPLALPQIRRLMECTVKLSGGYLFPAFLQMTHPRWTALAKETAAVSHHAVMAFRDGHWYSPDGMFHFEYDPLYGIIRHARNSHKE